MALRDWLTGSVATATPATPATLPAKSVPTVATVATVAVATTANEPGADPTARRRARALAMLSANPHLRIAAVAEPGDTAIIGIAIRSVVYGEMEIEKDRYDALAMIELMDRHAVATVH